MGISDERADTLAKAEDSIVAISKKVTDELTAHDAWPTIPKWTLWRSVRESPEGLVLVHLVNNLWLDSNGRIWALMAIPTSYFRQYRRVITSLEIAQGTFRPRGYDASLPPGVPPLDFTIPLLWFVNTEKRRVKLARALNDALERLTTKR